MTAEVQGFLFVSFRITASPSGAERAFVGIRQRLSELCSGEIPATKRGQEAARVLCFRGPKLLEHRVLARLGPEPKQPMLQNLDTQALCRVSSE